MIDSMRDLPFPYPGQILLHEFLEPMGLGALKLANAIGVPEDEVNELLRGRLAVSIELDRRLCEHFGTAPGFWTSLQSAYDLRSWEES